MPDNDFPYVAQVPRFQLGIEDAAAAVGLPVSTLEVEVRRGRGPLFFTVGRRKFTTPDLIREWQAEKIAAARAAERGEERTSEREKERATERATQRGAA